jgi:DNA-binding CsgD family transcriptional regulator
VKEVQGADLASSELIVVDRSAIPAAAGYCAQTSARIWLKAFSRATRREAEVLVLVAAGRTNRQIGQALFITPKTVSIHVSRILAKLGVTGRGEAAAVAHRLGLDKP